MMSRKIILVVLVITVLASWVSLGVRVLQKSITDKEVIIPTTTFEVIDSVWYLSPGELNTLQVDYLYYAKTVSGFKFRTSRLMNIGDTMYFSKK